MENICEPRHIVTHPVTAIALCAGLAGGIWGSLVFSYFQQRVHPRPAPQAVVAMAQPVSCPACLPRGIRRTGTGYQIDRAALTRLLDEASALGTSARFVPSLHDGKPAGFRIYAVRPCSLFAWLGMQNADRIKSINGIDISTPDRALDAYRKLQQASHISVDLERRGQDVTLTYDII